MASFLAAAHVASAEYATLAGVGAHRFRPRARFDGYDGKTRDIEATDTTGPAAERALKVKLRDRTPNDDEITRETRVSEVISTRVVGLIGATRA